MPKLIASLNNEPLKVDLHKLVRRTIKEMLSGLLDEEADDPAGAERHLNVTLLEGWPYRAAGLELSEVRKNLDRANLTRTAQYDGGSR